MPMRTVRCRVRQRGPKKRLELYAGKLARTVLRGPGGSNAIRLPDQALETKARFISQVMTGDNAARRAEDIGGQELSYAEVKAIASGNPAVLTLAAADAELQRLSILRRNHADEQFLARRNLKDLPATISRLTKRVSDLGADEATAGAHADHRIVIGERSYSRSDIPGILGGRLDALPDMVREMKRFPLGRYRGLAFGIVLHPGAASEVYLEGATIRHAMLSRDHRGHRAVLNALDRLAGSYDEQRATAQRDLEIAQGQLRDYEARLGAPFPHDAYLAELTGLRDQLRTGLSNATPPPGAEPAMPVSELAERINSLKAAHTIEAAPTRTGTRRSTAEEPVTTRIRRRNVSKDAFDPAIEEPGGAEPPSPLADSSDPSSMPDSASPAMTVPFAGSSEMTQTKSTFAAVRTEVGAGVIPIHPAGDADSTWNSYPHALSRECDSAQDRARQSTTQQHGSTTMAKTQKTPSETTQGNHEAPTAEQAAASATAQEYGPARQTTTPALEASDGEQAAAEPRTPIKTPDPRGVMSISLGDAKGSDRMQLRRSHQYKQMQIKFETQPDEKYLAMLAEAGWKDRTQDEGIWTKQVAPGQWQPVADAERLFKEIGNAIRKDRGLDPVFQGLAVA